MELPQLQPVPLMDKSMIFAAACMALAGAASAQPAPPLMPPPGREARHAAMEACKATVTMAQGKAGPRDCMAAKGFPMRHRPPPPPGAPPAVERGVVVPSQ